MRLTFTVTDSGIGITAADLKRLFRPFAQASGVARRYGGAGLGLVLVKRIAKAMGGDLAVTSKPGRGSTFRLTVVMKSAAPGRAPARAPAASPSPACACSVSRTIPTAASCTTRCCANSATASSFVGSGEAAVEAVARNEHDVVLMDVALPASTASRRRGASARSPAPAGRIPIIGISGRTEPRDAAAAKAAGMNAYLRKPASPAELNEALRSGG